jgi:glycosyltransferase involved in cell wall biosynthesis
VREVIEPGRNGLLADFFDIEGFVSQGVAVLDDPGAFRGLGEQAVARVGEAYSLDVCLPRMLDLYEAVCRRSDRAIS